MFQWRSNACFGSSGTSAVKHGCDAYASFLFIWLVMQLFFSFWSISKPVCSGFHWSNVPWPSRQPLPLDMVSGAGKTPSKHAKTPERRRPCGDGNICVDPRWPQAWIRMSHIVDFQRWWSPNPHLTGPLSLLWQYGLCTSKVPLWLRRSSVFLFQGWNRIMNASNVRPYVSTGRQRLFRRVCKELRADLSTVTLFTVIRESGLWK